MRTELTKKVLANDGLETELFVYRVLRDLEVTKIIKCAKSDIGTGRERWETEYFKRHKPK